LAQDFNGLTGQRTNSSGKCAADDIVPACHGGNAARG